MRKWLIPVLSAAALAACGETTEQRATTGAVGGGATGAVVGGPVGAVAGAGIGAVAGANREKIDAGTDKATAAAEEKIADATDQSARQQPTRARSAERVAGPDLTNAEVKEAQTALRNMGLYEGQIDGLYGPKTMAAVGKFQQQNNLPQTQALTEQTQQKLQQMAASGSGMQNQGSQERQPPSGQAPDSQPPAAQPQGQPGQIPDPQKPRQSQ